MTDNKKALSNESCVPTNILSQVKTEKNNNIIEKDSFILYQNYQEIFNALSDEKAGKLIKAIFAFTKNENIELDPFLCVVFIPIRQQLERDAKKYTQIVEQRRLAGSKGGKQRVANQANANFAKQNQANQADNVNVNVNEINNIRTTTFNKPTIEDIEKYCKERNNSINAEKFHNYYEANGWMVGKSKMKDWKAAIRTWEQNQKNFNNQSSEHSEQGGAEYVWNPNL